MSKDRSRLDTLANLAITATCVIFSAYEVCIVALMLTGMRNRAVISVWLGIVATFICDRSATAQQQFDPDELRVFETPYARPSQVRFSSEVSLVEAGVIVRDLRGNAVHGLQKGDFEILAGGKSREITSFAVLPGAPPSEDGTPRRFVAFVFDDFATGPRFRDIIYAKESAKRFVARGLSPGDVVSLFSFSGRQVLPFTRDAATIIPALDRITPRGFNLVRPAEIIEDIVAYMARMPGQRFVVVVSSMLYARPRQQEAIISRAIRSGVIINGVSAEGLTVRWERLREFDAMPNLTASTGGVHFSRNNDLVLGFKKTAAPPEVGYILGFAPDDVHDGRYRRISVKVKSRGAYSVQARAGYFAPEPAKSRTIDEVFGAQEALNGLPGARLLAVPKGNMIQAAVHLDIKTLPFRKRYDRRTQTVRFIAALLDENGEFVTGKEGVFSLH